jgi:ketosteroid isomerase-like protein
VSVTSPREFDEQFAKAFNGADLDTLIALYEPEAIFIAQPGSPVTGAAAAREALAYFVGLKGQIELRTASVTETAGLALVLSDWTISGAVDADGNAVPLGGQSTVVLRRQDSGNWLCVVNDPWSQR